MVGIAEGAGISVWSDGLQLAVATGMDSSESDANSKEGDVAHIQPYVNLWIVRFSGFIAKKPAQLRGGDMVS
jgi:hypothetical protein